MNLFASEVAPVAASPSDEAAEAVRGPLQPIELATAAVLGAMTVVLVVAGWFLPHATVIMTLGAIPMGVIAYRHRPRAVVAAVVAAASVGFLVAGTGVISTVVLCGVIGGLAGHAHRRGWGTARMVAASAVLGPVIAAAFIGLMVVLSSLRELTLEQIRNTWRGLSGMIGRIVGALPGLHEVGPRLTHDLDQMVDAATRDWWQTVGIIVIVFTMAAAFTAYQLLEIVFVRLDRVRAVDRLAPTGSASPGSLLPGSLLPGSLLPESLLPGSLVPGSPPPGPVPVRLHGVTVRYPGARFDALSEVTLELGTGEMVAVLGPNGSGKSTLSRVLAGCPPTGGDVSRAGAVGLGAPGGTAIVAQRPESQILGVRVADDVVWGLPRDFEVDVEAVLDDVGLSGMAARETSGLSGGQLQRLAVAAALARRPRLLISDESTAMIDSDGRRRLVALLSDLPQQRDMTVVHVTHRVAETVAADQVVHLQTGRVVGVTAGPDSGFGPPRREPSDRVRSPGPPGILDDDCALRPPLISAPAAPGLLEDAAAPLIRLDHVGHIYADGTPWAQTALQDIQLDIRAGEGVLVVGGNGSGKSTLAWILAGLVRPTFGACLLDGRPVLEQVGAVGLAFQHARLQVQRSTVGRDVRAAGDIGRDEAEAALRLVGLDPAELWDRAVDELSGGQLRRVALAGLLTRVPRVLVLDEPLAGLDDASRTSLLRVLADLRATHGLTLIVISHDLEGAGEICDRVVRLDAGRISADAALVAAVGGA